MFPRRYRSAGGLEPNDEKWRAGTELPVTARIRSEVTRAINRYWNINRDPNGWCADHYKQGVLNAIAKNEYWTAQCRDCELVGEWFPQNKTPEDRGEITIIRENMPEKVERAVVIHEAMHSYGVRDEDDAWEPVRCMGRHADDPRDGVGNADGGQGGGSWETGGRNRDDDNDSNDDNEQEEDDDGDEEEGREGVVSVSGVLEVCWPKGWKRSGSSWPECLF